MLADSNGAAQSLNVPAAPEVEAQTGTAAAADRTASAPRFQIDLGYERRRDRLRYRFENPSTFDSKEPVPHFFTQRYVADNNWLILRARYPRSRSDRWSTEVGVTPSIATLGEDFDTFFNPDGNVIVSGTSGEVHLWSVRVRQWLERTRRSGLVERLGYTYRRDRSRFRTPERKTITRTRPPSVEETTTFDHETTISQVHQIWVGWTRTRPLTSRWQISGDFDVAPATLARLNTLLPEKYPGRDIVTWAGGFDVGARLTLSRNGRWPIEASADVARSGPYRSSARFIRDSVGISLRIGRLR